MAEDTPPLYNSFASYLVAFVAGAMSFGPMMFPAGWLFNWMMGLNAGSTLGLLALGPYIVAQVIILIVCPIVIGVLVGAVADAGIDRLKGYAANN